MKRFTFNTWNKKDRVTKTIKLRRGDNDLNRRSTSSNPFGDSDKNYKANLKYYRTHHFN
jgi:hypothetical protein